MSALLHQMRQDSPVGLWPLDESSGTSALDNSGGAHNGTYVTSFTLSGKSVPFSPGGVAMTTGSVRLGTPAGLVSKFQLSDNSFEAWVRVTDFSARRAVFSGGAEGTDTYVIFMVQSTGLLLAFYGDDLSVTGLSLVVNRWYHVGFSYVNSTRLRKVYLDGAEVGSGTATGNLNIGTTKELELGRFWPNSGAPNETLQGSMSHAAVYGTALPAARFKAHYEAGIRGGVSY